MKATRLPKHEIIRTAEARHDKPEPKHESAPDLVGLAHAWAKRGAGRAFVTVTVDITGDDAIETRYTAYVEMINGRMAVSRTKHATFAEMTASIEGQLK